MDWCLLDIYDVYVAYIGNRMYGLGCVHKKLITEVM